jgi:flagellar biosynthetic protein FlhB
VITPDFSRLNPIRGFMRLWSREALVELLKSVAKLAVVAVIVYWWLSGEARAVVDLARDGWPGSLSRMTGLIANVFLIASFAVFVVSLFDVPYRIWSHRQDLRMSREERREEAREVEGNPHTKRRLRMAFRKLARMRMMTQVPSADVVLINPLHVSVALRYVEGSSRPPKLVAKGVGLVALHIREVAKANGVPLVEAPPLARALNRFVEIEDEIPVPLYRAVAEVLAFVYRLRAARDAGKPDIPVPQDGLFDPPEGLRV